MPKGKKREKEAKPEVSPIEKYVVNLISEKLLIDIEEVTMGAKLQEDLGADSVDLVEVMMDCEENFSIEITDEDFKDTLDVQDLIELMEAKVKAVAA